MQGIPGVLLMDESEQSERDFLGRRPVVEQAHGTALIQQYDGGGAGHVLGAIDLEIVGAQFHRHLRAAANDCVLHSGLQIQLQRITELVHLGIAQQVAAGAPGIQIVVADAVFLQVLEHLPHGLLPDAPDAPGRQVHIVVVSYVSGVLQQLPQAVQLFPRPPGLFAQQFGQLLRVNVVQVASAHGLLEGLFQPVQVLHLAHGLHSLLQGHAVVAQEGILPGQVVRRHEGLHQAGELGHFVHEARVHGRLHGVFKLPTHFG